MIDFVIRMELGDESPVAASRRIAEICGFDLPLRKDAGNGSERPLRGHRKPENGRKGSKASERPSVPTGGATGPPEAEKACSDPCPVCRGSGEVEVELPDTGRRAVVRCPACTATGGARPPATVAEMGNRPLTFQLTLDPEHPYRLERGAWLTPEVALAFGLGFCHGKGLMRGLYCGPIHDQHGQVVAYFGRRIDEIPAGQGQVRAAAAGEVRP